MTPRPLTALNAWLHPNDVEAHLAHALALHAEGRSPARAAAAAARGIGTAAEALRVGAFFEATGNLEAAVDAYRRSGDVTHGDLQLALGSALLRLDRAGDAVEPLTAAVAFAPDEVEAHLLLGRAARSSGRSEQACRALGAAYALGPDRLDVGLAYSAALLDARRATEAANVGDELATRFPESVEARLATGAAHIEADCPSEAIRPLREAVRLLPDFAPTHFNLGLALFERGDYASATAAAQIAVDLDPGLAEAHLLLAQALRRRLSRTRAATHARQALSLAQAGGATKRRAGLLLDELTGPQVVVLDPQLTPGESVEVAAELAGDLRTFGLPDLLEMLRNRRSTGALLLASEGGLAELVFQEGDLASARTAAAPSLLEVLVEFGELSPEMAEELGGGDAAAQTAVARGIITPASLQAAHGTQIVGVVRALMSWREGSFAFRRTTPAAEGVATYHTGRLLLEALRQLDEEAAN